MAGHITGILSRDIKGSWDSIKNAILKGSKKTDFVKLYPLLHIKRQLMDGSWQCWVSDKVVFLTCISVYPSGYKVFEILYVSGSGLTEWISEAWEVFKAFANHHGCDEVRFEERKGWQKIGLKYEPNLKTRHQYKVVLK